MDVSIEVKNNYVYAGGLPVMHVACESKYQDSWRSPNSVGKLISALQCKVDQGVWQNGSVFSFNGDQVAIVKYGVVIYYTDVVKFSMPKVTVVKRKPVVRRKGGRAAVTGKGISTLKVDLSFFSD